MNEPYRLSLDLGTNSIGWAVYALSAQGEPVALRRAGVRIFSDGRDPQSKSSLAVARREARQARRRRDRSLQRGLFLRNKLKELHLLPEEKREWLALVGRTDPYALRARGLDHGLTPWELGRVLTHMNQRRGFKSNRKEAGTDKEGGKIRVGMERTLMMMKDSQARTFGEFLWQRREQGETVRAKKGAENDFYPSRLLLEEEFDHLRAAQEPHHPLAEADWERLREIIFHQRPLKPVPLGQCPFLWREGKVRAYRAHPLSQRFRVAQDVAHLRWVDPRDRSLHPLSEEELTLARALLLNPGTVSGKVTFDKLRKALGLGADIRFNKETAKVTELTGDETAARLSRKDVLGKGWWELSQGAQVALVERMLAVADEEALVKELMEAPWGFSEGVARVLAHTHLPDRTMSLSLEAMARLIPHMEAGVSYAEAREREFPESFLEPEVLLDKLPYYGEVLREDVVPPLKRDGIDPVREPERFYGRFPNPTVHIALNQVRKLVNAAIVRWGKPTEVVLELARELKLNRKAQEEIIKAQKKNEEVNARIDRELSARHLVCNRENRIRFKLWEELGAGDDKPCPYCGKPIAQAQLFSELVEVEHILPFSRSLDDSYHNLTVSHRSCNRDKGNRSPWEAWGEVSDPRYDMAAILRRVEAAKGMSGRKKKFFTREMAESLQRKAEGDGELNEFQARQLTDTQYIARVVLKYLKAVVPANKVWGSPGKLTALLRAKWGLNSLLADGNAKNRTDHRHHAIDACVIGVTDRSLLQRMARASGLGVDLGDKRVKVEPPWEGFRGAVGEELARMVISHKPDHGIFPWPIPRGAQSRATSGALHEQTAFGIAGEPDEKTGYRPLVVREALDPASFKKPEELDKFIARLRDEGLRRRMEAFIRSRVAQGMSHTQALQGFLAQSGVKRARVTEPAKDNTLVLVADRQGRNYKAYKAGGNHCVEVYRKSNGAWGAEIITTYQANQPGFVPKWRHDTKLKGARFVMRLFKEDMVAIQEDDKRRILRVVKMTDGKITFIDHFRSILDKKGEDGKTIRYTFSKSADALQKNLGRKISVDILGSVRDPGPRDPVAGEKP